MGDRCQCTVYVRRDDLERVMPGWKEELGCNTDSERNGVLELGFDEVNYANVHNNGLPENIPCIIENSAGHGYTAGITVQDPGADPSVRNEWSTDGDEGFVFWIDEGGLPVVTDAWREFWALYQKVKKHIHGEGVAP